MAGKLFFSTFCFFATHTHTHMLNAVGKRQVPLCACVWVCMGPYSLLCVHPTVCAPYSMCVWVCMGVYGCEVSYVAVHFTAHSNLHFTTN